MTKFVLCILLLIAAFTVSAWFLVLIPVLLMRNIIVALFLYYVLKQRVTYNRF